MKKYSWEEICNLMCKYNKDNCISYSECYCKPCLVGYVVYKSSNWPENDYSLESRTYAFNSANKAFFPNLGGYSIFASAIDGSDPCVRIEHIGWEVDYCYLKEEYNG